MPVVRTIGRTVKGLGKGAKKGWDTLADSIRSISPQSPNNSSDNVPNSQNTTDNPTNEGSKQKQNEQPNDSVNPKHDNSFNSDKESITSNPKTTKLDF